jgi:hypothetical protein
MVASQPIERPDSSDFLVNQLRDLQQRVDELTRQSKYPFSVSHGGVPDFTVLPNADNSGAIVSIYDGAGTLVVATDANTKYGLARPYTQVPDVPVSAWCGVQRAGVGESVVLGATSTAELVLLRLVELSGAVWWRNWADGFDVRQAHGQHFWVVLDLAYGHTDDWHRLVWLAPRRPCLGTGPEGQPWALPVDRPVRLGFGQHREL